jgi:hypothetical protein
MQDGAGADSIVKDPGPMKNPESMNPLYSQAERSARKIVKLLIGNDSVCGIVLTFPEKPAFGAT